MRKDYEHRLGNDTYLSDLHSKIFQAIPIMLEDMNKQASICALTTKVNFDAFNPTMFPDSRKNRARGAGGGGCSASRGRAGQGGQRTESSARFVSWLESRSTCKPLYTSLRSIYIHEQDDDYKEEEDDQFGAEESGQADAELQDS